MTAVFKGTPSEYHDSGITYRLATAEELPMILQLRTLCYGEAGKHSGNATFTDRYDENACHLTAFRRTQPIGSMRILFNDPAEEWEHDRFFGWPRNFPDRSEVAEITRVCIRKEFRRTNVLLNLFKQGALTLLRGGRTWLLGCAAENLLPLYERIGCKRTNIRFFHEDIEGLEHEALIADVKAAFEDSLNPMTPSRFWREPAIQAWKEGLLSRDIGVV